MMNCSLANAEITRPACLAARLALAGIAFSAIGPSSAALSIEHDAGACADAGLSVAKFRMRVPDPPMVPKAILIFLGGRNSDARSMAEQSRWIVFARQNRLALLGCFLAGTEGDHSKYQLDENGATARHLNRAVQAIAERIGHAEFSDLPLVFWGASAGGNVGVAYAGHFPDRTVSVVSVVAPNGHGPPDRRKVKVPILAILGARDRPEWLSYALECYDCARISAIPWTLALHPSRGHNGHGSEDLAMAFLGATIERRLVSGPAKGAPLRELDISRDWLGDLKTHEVTPCANFAGDERRATWLPDRATSEAWRSYLGSP